MQPWNIPAGSYSYPFAFQLQQKGRIAGTFNLPRSSTSSAQTPLITSTYKITMELEIPWASDPVHEFNVVVAQTVDVSNTCSPILFSDSNQQCSQKGQLSLPEMGYAPPPQPVFNCQPIQMPVANITLSKNIPATPSEPSACSIINGVDHQATFKINSKFLKGKVRCSGKQVILLQPEVSIDATN